MADLITIDDFMFAGGDPDSVAAAFAMSAASEMVRGYLNQYVSLVTNDVILLTGSGTRALILPELPVVAINSVTVGGDALVVADYVESRGVLWRRTSDALDDNGVHITSTWTAGYDVVINYTHGYAVVPADIRLVTARIAVGIAFDAGLVPGLKQESVQDYSYTRADTSATAGAELAVLSRRVLRQVPVA